METHPFVGRERELADLQACLDNALSGQGQICFIAGQAGTGKSALVRHFATQAQAAHPELVVAVGNCDAQVGTGDPYLPFREALVMLTDAVAAQQAAGKVSPENTNRLRAVLVRSVQVLVEVAPDLVGAFLPGTTLVGALGKAVAEKTSWMDQLDDLVKEKPWAAGPLEAATDQSRVFEQYTSFLEKLTEKVPLILFLDDLQWADGASLNLLFHLARRLEKSRILILGAYRPDDVALGRDGERHPLELVVNELTRYYGDVSVDLDAIPEQTSRHFVDALLDAQPNCLADEFRSSLFHQTRGHALFTVELLRSLMERGDLVRDAEDCWVQGPSLDWSALPARIEGVIEERIDRLSQERREILQAASVQGEEFSAEVVAQVQAIPKRTAIWELSRELQRRHRLVEAQGMVMLGRVRLSRYRFTHSLFQHYLYDNLSEAERAYLHQDTGQALEEMLAGSTDVIAGQLARHFEHAALPAKAAAYRLQAGSRAHRMSAHQEAAHHLTRGLALTEGLPPGPERMQLQLQLQVILGTVLIAMYGYASPRVDRVFAEARELSRALGDPPQAITVLLARAVFSLMRGQLDRALEDAEQVLGVAEQAGDKDYALTSHLLLGATAMYMARYDRARQHLERVVALYDVGKHRHLATEQGQDPGVRARAFLSRLLWLQGEVDQAEAQSAAALRLATDVEHPYSLTVAQLHAATLHAMLRQWPACQSRAEDAQHLAAQGGFSMWAANAAILHGLALAHQGQVAEGVAELTQGLYQWEATGAGLVAYGRTCLAEAYWLAGQREEGLRAVDEALYPSQETWWRPEQLRLQAQLLRLAPGSEVEAEALLRQAADLARDQGAKVLELRVWTSLMQLLHPQGRTAEVKERLAECYAGFPAGLDLPDLLEAREWLAHTA